MDHNHPHFANPVVESATVEDGRIVSESSYDVLADHVLGGDVVVLQDVFDAAELWTLRDEIFQWGLDNPVRDIDPEDATESFHRIDDNPTETHFPRLYHFYYFGGLSTDDSSSIDERVNPVFETLRDLQNAVAGTDASFTDTGEGPHLRPQAIHYPAGGGYFAMHKHDFLPQKVGLILSLSAQGEDFEHGGTRFASGDRLVDIEGHHDIGDIALFRYDLPHAVVPTDPTEELRFDRVAGRWSMILPYY